MSDLITHEVAMKLLQHFIIEGVIENKLTNQLHDDIVKDLKHTRNKLYYELIEDDAVLKAVKLFLEKLHA